ncbi:MAG: hypothetical protein ABF633_03330 [Clostridium sp.]|uniref:hypothetical protein n=1 Tax=Clostridium sp. TaxID=1506 RepID=UPI0039ED296F
MENKVIASLTVCNTATLNIYSVDYGIDDYITVGLNNFKSRKYKLYSTNKGTYFNYDGLRYYVHEFLKVGAVV